MRPQPGKDVMGVLPHRLDHDQRRIRRQPGEHLQPLALAVDEPVPGRLVEPVAAHHRPPKRLHRPSKIRLQLLLDRPALHIRRQPQITTRHREHRPRRRHHSNRHLRKRVAGHVRPLVRDGRDGRSGKPISQGDSSGAFRPRARLECDGRIRTSSCIETCSLSGPALTVLSNRLLRTAGRTSPRSPGTYPPDDRWVFWGRNGPLNTHRLVTRDGR